MTAETRVTHTAGPWKAWRQDTSIRSAAVMAEAPHAIASGHKFLAVVVDQPEHEANARLIAAAPDLLEALEALVAHPKVQRAATVQDFHRALDAIAKARGQS